MTGRGTGKTVLELLLGYRIDYLTEHRKGPALWRLREVIQSIRRDATYLLPAEYRITFQV